MSFLWLPITRTPRIRFSDEAQSVQKSLDRGHFWVRVKMGAEMR